MCQAWSRQWGSTWTTSTFARQNLGSAKLLGVGRNGSFKRRYLKAVTWDSSGIIGSSQVFYKKAIRWALEIGIWSRTTEDRRGIWKVGVKIGKSGKSPRKREHRRTNPQKESATLKVHVWNAQRRQKLSDLGSMLPTAPGPLRDALGPRQVEMRLRVRTKRFPNPTSFQTHLNSRWDFIWMRINCWKIWWPKILI